MEAEMGGGVAECGSSRARARICLAYFQNQYVTLTRGRGADICVYLLCRSPSFLVAVSVIVIFSFSVIIYSAFAHALLQCGKAAALGTRHDAHEQLRADIQVASS